MGQWTNHHNFRWIKPVDLLCGGEWCLRASMCCMDKKKSRFDIVERCSTLYSCKEFSMAHMFLIDNCIDISQRCATYAGLILRSLL